MTTTATTLTIVCPDWCTIDPQQHAKELWDHEGLCFHRSEDFVAHDESDGPERGWGDRPMPGQPISTYLVRITNPAGDEVGTPAFGLVSGEGFGEVLSIQHVLAVIETLQGVVDLYRDTDGRAETWGSLRDTAGGAA